MISGSENKEARQRGQAPHHSTPVSITAKGLQDVQNYIYIYIYKSLTLFISVESKLKFMLAPRFTDMMRHVCLQV